MSAGAPFLLRRMASSWLLLSSLMVTVLITAALTAALASFDTRVLPQAAHRQLASSAQTAVVVSGAVDAQVAAADRPAVRSALRAAFGSVPFQLDSALWSDPLGLPARAGGRLVRLAEAAAPDQIRAHAALVSGSWPGPPRPGQPIPAALPETAAGQLRLATGDVVAVRDRDTGGRLRLRVSGLFALRDPADRYWGLDLIGTSGVSVQPGFASYGPVLVSPAAFGRGGLAVGRESWVALPDPARIQPGQLAGLAARISQSGSYLQGSVRLGGLQVMTGMPQLLDGLSRRLAVGRSLLAISALQLLLLAAAALGLAARLLTGHREEENALLSSRGAARWQLARITVAEILLLAAVAAAAGAIAGSRLAGLLVRAGSLRAAGLSLPGFPASAWLAAALVVALCLVVMVWPALRPGAPGTVRVRHGRQAAVAGVARSGADIALVALALIAVRELRAYSAVARLRSGGLGFDPVLAAAPALALAAVSLILLRLLPVVARAMERLIARSRHLGGALASWEISRRAIRQSGPVLLALLAVATGTLALAQYQSWRQSAQDQAAFAVGADVRVRTAGPASLSQADAISHAPGVTAAMPVSRLAATSQGTVLALDARQAAATMALRPDLSPLPAVVLWRRITPAAARPGQPARGLVLPGRPVRLEVVASAAPGRGASLGQLSARVTIQDAVGVVAAVPAGSLRADGQGHALTADLSGIGQASYPLRLLGLSLTYSLPQFPSSRQATLAAGRPVTITFASVAVSSAAAGPFAAPFSRGSSLAGWQVIVSAPSLAILDTLGQRSGALGPALAGSRPGAGGSREISFQPGRGPDPAVLGKIFAHFPVTGYTGTMMVLARAPTPVIAGVAAHAFLTANHLRLGAIVPVAVSGAEVPVRIVAVIAAVPTVAAGGALVVDLGAIQDLLASHGADPLPVTQWWLRTAGGAVPGGLPDGSVVTDRAATQAALLRNPLSAAPLLEGLAIAAAAAVLAAVGFSVGVAASLRARRSQSALLAALGYSRAAQARGLCLEQAMLTVPAALAGLAVGTGLAHLLVPAITLTASATVPVPAVLVKTPLGWAGLLTLAVAATPVAVAAAAAMARRPDPAAQLRAAEQA
jgi:FtsX-like permease family